MAKNNRSSSGSSANQIYRGCYSTLILLFHLIAAIQFAFSVYYDYSYVHIPQKTGLITNPFGGKFKYLTFIDAILQTLYYIVAVANDIVGTNEAAPTKTLPLVRKLKDFMMSALAFPVALNVGITFWGLYAIDRELVFPKALDPVFPNWLNHVMHTNIVVFIVLELFTSFRVYPKRSSSLLALSTFMLSYLTWVHIVKFKTGLWVYPVLDVLNLPYRICFFAVVLSITIALYLLGETINNMVWVKELKLAQKKVK